MSNMRSAGAGTGSGQARRSGEGRAFLREFIKNPTGMAAVAPSSKGLAKMMVAGLDLASMRTVVEFGPGTGVFTRAVLAQLPQGWCRAEGGAGQLIAIEFNPRMVEVIRTAMPRVDVVHESAANIQQVCGARGVGPGEVDVIVSGLGFASFPNDLTTQVLEAAHRMLRPGGEFRTFTYHVSLVKRQAWHFKREARRLFADVRTSRAVWANVPPAFVYTCTK